MPVTWSRMMRRLAALLAPVLVVLASGGGMARADETIRLKNGNTLRGSVTSKTSETLVIDIDGLGKLSLPMADIEAIVDDAGPSGLYTHLVQLKNRDKLYGAIEEDSDTGVKIAVPGMGTMTFTRDEVLLVRELTRDEIAAQTKAHQAAPDTVPLQAPVSAAAPAAPVPAADRDAQVREAQQKSEQMLNAVRKAYGVGTSAAPAAAPPAVQDQITQLQQDIAAKSAGVEQKTAQAHAMVDRVRGFPLSTGFGSGPAQQAVGRMPGGGQLADAVQWFLNAAAALGIWFWVLLAFMPLFYAICLQRLAERSSTPDDWMAYFPLLHLYLFCQVAGRPGWWIILLFVPVVNIVVDMLMWASIAAARGHRAWLGLLSPLGMAFLGGMLFGFGVRDIWLLGFLVFPVLSWVMVALLAFGKDVQEPGAPTLRMPREAPVVTQAPGLQAAARVSRGPRVLERTAEGYALHLPGFEDRKVVIKLPMWSKISVAVDGEPAPRQGKAYLLRDNSGAFVELKVMPRMLDPLPLLEYAGEELHLARPFTWYEYLWMGLPIALMFLGGALGGGLGFLGVYSNARVLRSSMHPVVKFLLTGFISLFVTGLFMAVAALLHIFVFPDKPSS